MVCGGIEADGVAVQGVRQGSGETHDALLPVADGRDRGVAEGGGKERQLRAGGVLELVDEHIRVRDAQRAPQLRPGTDEQLGQAVEHDEINVLGARAQVVLTPPGQRRIIGHRRRRARRVGRQGPAADDLRQERFPWQPVDVELKLPGCTEGQAVDEILLIPVCPELNLVGAVQRPFLGQGGPEPVDEALGKRVECERNEPPRVLGDAGRYPAAEVGS